MRRLRQRSRGRDAIETIRNLSSRNAPGLQREEIVTAMPFVPDQSALLQDPPLPVIGVPVQSKALNGLDSLLSIVQMPGGVPVATVAIGKAGAVNAGLLAAQILSAFDEKLAGRLDERRESIRKTVLESSDQLV